MSDELLPAGYVRRAHGLKGSVVVRSLSDDPDRFRVGARFATDDAEHPWLTVIAAVPHHDGLLIAFDGITGRNEAEELRGTTLLIDRAARRDLDEDEFWPEDLVGLDVVDASGSPLGEVVDVVLGAAQDRVVVKTTDGGIVEVPLVAALAPEIDLEAGTIVVDPPEGLFVG